MRLLFIACLLLSLRASMALTWTSATVDDSSIGVTPASLTVDWTNGATPMIATDTITLTPSGDVFLASQGSITVDLSSGGYSACGYSASTDVSGVLTIALTDSGTTCNLAASGSGLFLVTSGLNENIAGQTYTFNLDVPNDTELTGQTGYSIETQGTVSFPQTYTSADHQPLTLSLASGASSNDVIGVFDAPCGSSYVASFTTSSIDTTTTTSATVYLDMTGAVGNLYVCYCDFGTQGACSSEANFQTALTLSGSSTVFAQVLEATVTTSQYWKPSSSSYSFSLESISGVVVADNDMVGFTSGSCNTDSMTFAATFSSTSASQSWDMDWTTQSVSTSTNDLTVCICDASSSATGSCDTLTASDWQVPSGGAYTLPDVTATMVTSIDGGSSTLVGTQDVINARHSVAIGRVDSSVTLSSLDKYEFIIIDSGIEECDTSMTAGEYVLSASTSSTAYVSLHGLAAGYRYALCYNLGGTSGMISQDTTVTGAQGTGIWLIIGAAPTVATFFDGSNDMVSKPHDDWVSTNHYVSGDGFSSGDRYEWVEEGQPCSSSVNSGSLVYSGTTSTSLEISTTECTPGFQWELCLNLGGDTFLTKQTEPGEAAVPTSTPPSDPVSSPGTPWLRSEGVIDSVSVTTETVSATVSNELVIGWTDTAPTWYIDTLTIYLPGFAANGGAVSGLTVRVNGGLETVSSYNFDTSTDYLTFQLSNDQYLLSTTNTWQATISVTNPARQTTITPQVKSYWSPNFVASSSSVTFLGLVTTITSTRQRYSTITDSFLMKVVFSELPANSNAGFETPGPWPATNLTAGDINCVNCHVSNVRHTAHDTAFFDVTTDGTETTIKVDISAGAVSSVDGVANTASNEVEVEFEEFADYIILRRYRDKTCTSQERYTWLDDSECFQFNDEYVSFECDDYAEGDNGNYSHSQVRAHNFGSDSTCSGEFATSTVALGGSEVSSCFRQGGSTSNVNVSTAVTCIHYGFISPAASSFSISLFSVFSASLVALLGVMLH